MLTRFWLSKFCLSVHHTRTFVTKRTNILPIFWCRRKGTPSTPWGRKMEPLFLCTTFLIHNVIWHNLVLLFVNESSSMLCDRFLICSPALIHALCSAESLTSHITSLITVFTDEDCVVVKFLCLNKGYGARRLVRELLKTIWKRLTVVGKIYRNWRQRFTCWRSCLVSERPMSDAQESQTNCTPVKGTLHSKLTVGFFWLA